MLKIRASALSYYLDCPRREAAKLFWREVRDAGFNLPWRYKLGIAAAIGSGSHAGVEFALNNTIETGAPGKVEDLIEIAISNFKGEITDAEGADYDDTTPNNNDAEKQIQLLTRSFYFEILPNINVDNSDTEIPFEAKLDNVLFTGKADFISESELHDFKFARISDYSAQLGAYSLLNKSQGFPAPKILISNFMPRVAVGKPYPGPTIIPHSVQDSEEAAFNIVKIIKRDAENFLKDGNPWAFAANPKSILCSTKYCKCFGSEFCKLGVKK